MVKIPYILILFLKLINFIYSVESGVESKYITLDMNRT